MPSFEKLDNIAIPSNLSEILASIKGATVGSMGPVEEYDPTSNYSSSAAAQYSAGGSSYKTYSSSEAMHTPTADSSGPSKAVLDVDEEMNEDDFFEFPDDDGLQHGKEN